MDEFELRINAEICNVRMGDRLHISESMTIKATSLLDVLAALTKFHELAQSLRAAKGGK